MIRLSSVSKIQSVLIACVLAGCATWGGIKFANLYGTPQPRDREVETLQLGDIDFWRDVKPLLESRCVVCHACYDAPCQLKLTAIEGIERGASTQSVYDAARLFEAEPTRLFEDAHSVAEWRSKGFHPVLNEHDQTLPANRAAGLMYQMLQLKSQSPLPASELLSDDFTLGLNRKNECPTAEEFDNFASSNPLWGMPYALPGLAAGEQKLLLTWLEQGAVHTARPEAPESFRAVVMEWERFFNQRSLRGRLVSRYIYEHLFLASLHFDELDERRFFRLVRSRSAPGQPVEIIATRRPYDDPGVDRFYYRLVESAEAVVAKTHMPYALNTTRMNRWHALFYERDYAVDALPGYQPEVASNPFLTFIQLPVTSRYQFMLDEAQYTVMGFIKGPVCRGQVALNVINDHFWVFFVKPSEAQDTALSEFLAQNGHLLSLPSERGSTLRPLHAWRNYSMNQRKYLAERDEYLVSLGKDRKPIGLSDLWDGKGTNPNAALTVFRHYDSATVEKGLLGKPPKTAWVVGYMDLERIHYLLVAGYDVYGNLGHQLLSRLYMDFLRMESEGTFLLLLPQKNREAERSFWYRGADQEVLDFLTSPEFEHNYGNTSISYETDNPKLELLRMLATKYEPVTPDFRKLSTLPNRLLADKLSEMEEIKGSPATKLPESSLILVETAAGDQLFTLLRNSAHLNMTSMFSEQKNRVPSEDRLVVLRGLVGSYPNLLFRVKEADIGEFVGRVSDAGTDEGFSELMRRFAVRRTDPDFWAFSDRVHKTYAKFEPLEHGILDYNRLENR